MPRPYRRLLCLTILALAACAASLGAAPRAKQGFLIRDVRVFDGRKVIAKTSVLVLGKKISAVRPRLRAPAGVEVIDGRGKTLLPGLIDSHSHATATEGFGMRDALVLGVTTSISLFDVPEAVARIRAEHVDGQASQLALSAGILATAPGGHGTQYGLGIPTVTRPEEAQAFVDARLAEGSDFLKITYEDFRHVGYDIPKLSPETLKALIDAAHRRKRLAVVHVMQRADTRVVFAAGADGIVHTLADEFPDPDIGDFAAGRGAFVIPTLALYQELSHTVLGIEPLDDPLLEPFLSPQSVAALRTQAVAGFARINFEAAVESVRRFHEARVPVLAGSDAGNPGTADGATLHRELEMLVYAGLKPAEALAAATSVPAAAFRLRDRGRIAPGLRADLLLVNGNPAADVRAARDIAAIWQGGVRVSRAGE